MGPCVTLLQGMARSLCLGHEPFVLLLRSFSSPSEWQVVNTANREMLVQQILAR